MIIGIAGNSKSGKKELSEFFRNNYSIKYFDLDRIISKELLDKIEDSNVKRIIDSKILEICESVGKNQMVAFDYTFLEDSPLVNICEILIKANKKDEAEEQNIFNRCKREFIDSKFKETSFHLELNMNNSNWQETLRNYIDFNLKSKDKVTIIVPIHNTLEYLPKCIVSILNQTYKNLEIILIDDGSTDKSLEMCNLFATMDSRIKVIHQDNVGLAETRNRGIDISTGEYICFIDSDDYMENDMVETLLRNIKQTNSDVASVRAYVHTRNGNIRRFSSERKIDTFNGPEENIEAYANGLISIAVWDKLFKKSYIDETRFDRSVFKEDTDFMLKMSLKGGRFICDTKECYNYVQRTSNSITATFNEKIFQLRDWSIKAYSDIINACGIEHKAAAEKCLFNGLSHILKTYMRDIKFNKVVVGDFKEKLQIVANDLIMLLLNSDDVSIYDDLDNTLDILNYLLDNNYIDRNKIPNKEILCIGILWNALNTDLIKEAISDISKKAIIEDSLLIDLGEQYQNFINDIYYFNHDFEGIAYYKACALIDKYDSNTIAILRLVIKVSGIVKDKMKGYMFKEICELKHQIRDIYKKKIRNYAYDNVFHLTVDDSEYQFTDGVIRKYIKKDEGLNHGRK